MYALSLKTMSVFDTFSADNTINTHSKKSIIFKRNWCGRGMASEKISSFFAKSFHLKYVKTKFLLANCLLAWLRSLRETTEQRQKTGSFFFNCFTQL